MALLDALFKRNVVTGVVLVAGVAVLVPGALPAAVRFLRPAAKSLMKGGLMLYARGRESLAETGEVVEDIVAEVKADLAADQAAAAAGAAEAAETAGEAMAEAAAAAADVAEATADAVKESL
jgi:hypothetical protein